MKKIKTFLESAWLVFFTFPLNTFVVFGLSVCEGFIPAALALIMKNLVDAISVPAQIDLQYFSKLVLIWLAAMILSQALSTLLRFAIDIYKVKLANQLSETIIKKRLSFFGIAIFEDESFLKVYNRLGNTHVSIENFVNNSRHLIKSIIQFISLFIIFMQFEFWVPLLIFISIIPGIFTAKKMSKISLAQEDLYYDKEMEVSYYRNALISPNTAREIRIFDFGKLFTKKFKSSSDEFFRQNKKFRLQIAVYDFVGVLARILGAGILMYLISKEAITGKISVGLLAMFLQSVFSFSSAMLEMVETWSYLDTVLDYFNKLFGFLKMQDSIVISKPAKILNDKIHTIEFKNVSFAYNADKKVLDNVSFKINADEIIALVGENGAGKSTIIKLIARFYDPVSGDIFVNGINLKDLDLQEYQNKISAVFQDYVKYNLTVNENIFAYSNPTQEPSKKVDLNFCANLDEGFDTRLGSYLGGRELSGGEWQRLAIARGLAKTHELLLVDEPTASIDPIQERSIYESLLTGQEMVLLVTHRLGSVRRANRILVLQNGKLIGNGTHTELMMECKHYNELYNSQASMYKE